ALMTIANLVPLLMYYAWRLSSSRDNKNGAYVSIGAYVIYIISEYVVLWFSRTREYYADRFSGQVTNNPNALATALVKIAYGLCASQPKPAEAEIDGKKKKKKEKAANSGIDALGALNIFDKKAATAL